MSKFVKPQTRSFVDSFDLEFLVSKPLPTKINLLLFLNIDAAKEYFGLPEVFESHQEDFFELLKRYKNI